MSCSIILAVLAKLASSILLKGYLILVSTLVLVYSCYTIVLPTTSPGIRKVWFVAIDGCGGTWTGRVRGVLYQYCNLFSFTCTINNIKELFHELRVHEKVLYDNKVHFSP